MTSAGIPAVSRVQPSPAAVLELLKPVTWFAPMWAYLCGAVSTGVSLADNLVLLLGGVVLAGPMVCAASQAVNDWYDRHVDAINEPHRPIPSGRIPGRWGLIIAFVWTGLSLALAAALGGWALIATAVALALAWAYSAPPVRLKMNGWLGPLAVGFSYEGIAWVTGAAVLAQAAPPLMSVAIAALYSIGAFGIMTLNDFKAVEGDTRLGVRSLPVVYGPERAALIACAVMAAPQIIVSILLVMIGAIIPAAFVGASLIAQLFLMRRLLTDPRKLAPWYNATGVSLYVLGMMAAALGLAGAL